jgi:hypothetical protein
MFAAYVLERQQSCSRACRIEAYAPIVSFLAVKWMEEHAAAGAICSTLAVWPVAPRFKVRWQTFNNFPQV